MGFLLVRTFDAEVIMQEHRVNLKHLIATEIAVSLSSREVQILRPRLFKNASVEELAGPRFFAVIG